MPAGRPLRDIALLGFDGVRILDITGPAEVFDVARALGCGYEVTVYSCSDGPLVRSSSGLAFEATPGSNLGDVDTVIVPGGDILVRDRAPDDVQRLIGLHARRARRVAALGTGSFALASTGLLDGRRATTHWRYADSFAARHPSTILDRDSVLVRDGKMWTAADGCAAIDLALALVAEDHGEDLAQEIAKDMVVLGRRMAGHPQISVAARTPRPRHPELVRLMATINVDPAGRYELETVAARIGMSPRHLARVFKSHVGLTLRQYVHAVRLENALGLVLAGESFHSAARRSGLRYGPQIRDHLASHNIPSARLPAARLLMDSGSTKPVSVRSG
ncbi:GlxA family transcriptional regulator [Mycobacterium sp. SMC-4]|uniref:GlxA family transcriptional regulator n=1 Tax=Mycobacterium sp. SMC-4 TaxID=2857059 RepID=UPI0021B19E0E|nr:DJ-1/PfpI family protein [Mycobacterium sp. SMC-4]UXA18029.1 DJ-1/PfpI family protein [Mycobacterium sp. SMC-4]